MFGTWWLTNTAIPLLRESDDPNIVNVTSLAGARPTGSSIASAMASAALNHMTLLLAKCYGPIRVNAVAPGLVATPWTEDWDVLHVGDRADRPTATAEDCTEAVLALLRNRYATGQVSVVDGGLSPRA